MKKLLIHIICLGIPSLSLAQGWVTKNANVVLKDDAHVVITTADGHYTSKGNSLVSTTNAGTLHVIGNWVNNGTTPAIGNNGGTVILEGGVQRITGTTETSFNTLEFGGTANKITDLNLLVGGGYLGAKSGKLILNDKTLYLNSKQLTINNPKNDVISRSAGLLIGDTDPLTGYGKVQWNIRSQPSGVQYEIPFGTADFIHIPLSFTIGSAGAQVSDSGHVVFATYPTDPLLPLNNRPLPIGVPHMDNEYGIENDIKTVDRFYIVQGDGYSANPQLTFGFSYVDREWDGLLGSLNNINEAELEAAKFDGVSGQWDYSLRGSTSMGAGQTTSQTTNDFVGIWVLHNSPYCPVSNFTFVEDCFRVPTRFTDSSYIEVGTIDTSIWVYEGSLLADQNNLLHNFSSDGIFTVTRKVRGDRGCWDSINKTIEVFPLPVNNFYHSDTCFTDVTRFVSTSTSTKGMPLTHNWNIEGNTFVTDQPAHDFSADGTYPIRLETENAFGCKDTLIRDIVIEPLPNVGFSFDNICERQEAQFLDQTTTKGVIDNWKWVTKGRTVSFQQDHSQVFNLPGSNPVQLTVQNSFGCIDSLEQQIVIWPKALARFKSFPKEIFITEPFVNFVQDGANANSWEWRFGDLSDDEMGPEVFHEYKDTGLYNIRLIANNDFGCADTFFRTIWIKPDLRIYIPNAFSPGGGNDVNTTFKPGGTLHGLKKLEMDIYTRWGELIYHSEDINQPWDGTYQGKFVQNGTYLYVMKVKDIYNDVFHFSGTVTVVK